MILFLETYKANTPLSPASSSQIREEGEKIYALFRRHAVEKGAKSFSPLRLFAPLASRAGGNLSAPLGKGVGGILRRFIM
jgi:hypothetical protein